MKQSLGGEMDCPGRLDRQGQWPHEDYLPAISMCLLPGGLRSIRPRRSRGHGPARVVLCGIADCPLKAPQLRVNRRLGMEESGDERFANDGEGPGSAWFAGIELSLNQLQARLDCNIGLRPHGLLDEIERFA
jgi:hypothetical protein